MHSPLRGAAALAALSFFASSARAQNLVGGVQSFVWGADCSTDAGFTNNTKLTLAGLWIAVDAVGTNSPPELRDIRAQTPGAQIWDVDDNEDLDNDDVGESDTIDSTPNGPASSNGWHRVQARNNSGLLAPGATLNLRLCDLNGASVSGRTVFLLPIAQKAGSTGGDQGPRVQPAAVINRLVPSQKVILASAGAPPNSIDFAFAMENQDPSFGISKVALSASAGVTIAFASASGGGTYDSGLRIVVWPSPIPAGCIEQLNTTVDILTATTTVTYAAAFKTTTF